MRACLCFFLLLFSVQVPHIIVCGHYDCGAIKAADKRTNHEGPLENWLTSIRDVKRLHKLELTRLQNDGRARERRLVEVKSKMPI